MHQRTFTLPSVGLIALLLLAEGSLASTGLAQTNPASRFLQTHHERVNRIIRQPANTPAAQARRASRVTRVLNQLLDYNELSRRALSQHWDAHSESERERFVSLLRQLVEKNYQNNLEHILEFRVDYLEETSTDGGRQVRTEARSRTARRQPPVSIDYQLREARGSWRVVDITTDGVSLVSNYRNQFNRIIQRDGWDALITRMQERLAERNAESSEAGAGTSNEDSD